MRTPTRKVALIDDNAIFRMIFGTMISSFENIEFTNYENALDALEGLKSSLVNNSKIPDYLFVDINMPYMTGWEMMDKLQEDEYSFLQNSKIFIVSSSHLESDTNNTQQYTFITEYIQKPVKKEKLIEILALP
ncbi:response regulator [Sphingobacterium bovisgrunnientis]|uniref:response regulator n=1 Tax=Sphingobacterium bovisgrunnientis TaxID=1874697 RepID=UPI001359C50E|nr:response regulator [Sphingobacterium bovisgrunnientis]